MAIGDNRKSDMNDLTTEHLERVGKGKRKLAVQMNAMFAAVYQLKRAAESRVYFFTEDQWNSALSEMRREIDGLELHLNRLDERRRGPRTWDA